MISASKQKKQGALQLIQHITSNAMGGTCLVILAMLLCWSPVLPLTLFGMIYTLLCGHQGEMRAYLPLLSMIISGALTAASALFAYSLFAIDSKKAGNRLDCGNSKHQWSIIALLACNVLAMICSDSPRYITILMAFSFLASGSFLILTAGGPIVKPATEVKFMHHQAGEWICRIVPATGPVLQAIPGALENKTDIEAPAAIKTPETTISTTTTSTIVYNTAPTSAGTDAPPMYSAALETMNQVEAKQ